MDEGTIQCEFFRNFWCAGGIRLGINLEKRRRKMKIVERRKYSLKDHLTGVARSTRIVVREPQWIAWVYKIPSFVKRKQNCRNFEIVSGDIRHIIK